MALTLPEQRLRMGKAQKFGVEPVSLHTEKDPLKDYRDRADQVYRQGEKFSQKEIGQILARIVLGL